MLATLREQYAKRRLLVGVDRLDYSKGLPQRIRAFRTLLERYPENRHSATLIQVAAPSREDVQCLCRHPARARGPVRRHQRRLRRARLDADPLHPPHGGAQAAAGAVPFRRAWRW